MRLELISLSLIFLLYYHSSSYSFFFFFNDTATTEIYTLSLHDALPIFITTIRSILCLLVVLLSFRANAQICSATRSEEHTSGLQSHVNLVCRLLLEKKKKKYKLIDIMYIITIALVSIH